jgi:DNA replication protein DnaC
MNVQATIDQLERMKLHGMAGVYKAVSGSLTHEQPGLDQFMARLAEAEQQDRQQKKTIMYLKTSKLRYNTSLQEVICSSERNISKDEVLKLADCSFIKRAENVLITGSTGTGKSFLACAIGRQACHMGLRTVYLGMNKFIERIALSKVDGTFIKLVNQIEKNDLIILDDFGLQPLDAHTRLALLQILEDCYQRKAVIVTSQLPVAKWYDYIQEPTLADAILDRLLSNANRIELKGPSLRDRKSNK